MGMGMNGLYFAMFFSWDEYPTLSNYTYTSSWCEQKGTMVLTHTPYLNFGHTKKTWATYEKSA